MKKKAHTWDNCAYPYETHYIEICQSLIQYKNWFVDCNKGLIWRTLGLLITRRCGPQLTQLLVSMGQIHLSWLILIRCYTFFIKLLGNKKSLGTGGDNVRACVGQWRLELVIQESARSYPQAIQTLKGEHRSENTRRGRYCHHLWQNKSR
jgi:hypothetical protein